MLSALALPSLKKIESDGKQIQRLESIVMTLCLVVFIFTIWQDYSFPNLWLDEYTQFLIGQGDPALGAAAEQQPPSSYILTKFLSFFFGISKTIARLTGFIPLTLALYFFLLFGLRVSSSIPFALLLTSFFITDPDIRYLSLEGRPVGLGLCSLAATTLAFSEFFKRPSSGSLFYIFATSYIFLTSVGMQPVILLGYFSILTLIFYLTTKKEVFKKVTTALNLSFILFLPIQIDIFLKANNFKKFHASFYERLFKTINHLSFTELSTYLLPEGNNIFWISFFVISFVTALYIMKSSSKKASIFLLLLFIASFPLVFHFTYFSIINWTLNRWYYACYLVFSFVLASTILTNRGFKRLSWILASLFTVIILIGADTHNYYALKLGERPNWEQLYKTIKKEEPQRVYILGYCNQYTWWCYNFFVGAEMWHKENDETIRGMNGRFAEYGHLQDNGMIHDSQHLKDKVHLSIVIIARETLDDYQQILSLKNPPYKISSYENFIIIETLEPVYINKEISRVLPWLTLHLPKNIESFFPYSLLVWDYKNKGLLNKSALWYQRLLNLPKFEEEAIKHPLGAEILLDLQHLSHPQKQ